jgi:hypothetical protein
MAAVVPPEPPSLARALVLAGALVFVDALWLNQGLYSLLFAAGVLLIGLPRALLRKFRPVRRQRLRNLAIYLCAVLLVWVLNILNNRIAQSRAEELIAAVKAYRGKNGRYPQRLQELVPSFIAQVPRAKYTLSFNTFTYVASDADPLLMYAALPPFGRPVYSFAGGTWGYLD